MCLMTSLDRKASARDKLTELDYDAENIHRHHRAHNGSDIFCRFRHLFCRGIKAPRLSEAKFEKTSC